MPRSTHRALRIANAAVWLLFGVAFKLLGLLPRHRLIVAAIVGEAAATPVTRLIGAAEALMGLWILSGWRPRTCALAQTLAIMTMNAIELSVARDLLLSPVGMLCANAVFLTVVWYVALQRPAAAQST